MEASRTLPFFAIQAKHIVNWACVVFVCSFLALVYFTREAFRAFVSPEFKSDMRRLNEQRRRRRAAKRGLR